MEQTFRSRVWRLGDNIDTDIIIMTEAMKVVRKKLVNVIRVLSKFAEEYKDLPTLAFTHFQPAQPTTVGKRATLWMQDLLSDRERLRRMGQDATKLAAHDASEKIYQEIIWAIENHNK